VDIWTAQLQIKVAGNGITRLSDAGYALNCFTLTTNAIAYDFQNDRFLEKGFFLSLQNREIDLGHNSHWVAPWISYHAAHIAHVKSLTGFSLSTRALERLRQALTPEVFEEARPYLQSRKKNESAIRFLEDVLAGKPF
jgi:hypothetical protein